MELDRIPESVVALYAALADVEATLHELQQARISYPDIRMEAHTDADSQPLALKVSDLPPTFWSLMVVLDEPMHRRVEELLRRHQPLAVGYGPAPHHGRSDTDRGAIAWRHYVFATPAGSDQVGESAGTTGTTGVISSGVFAEGAVAEGTPPVRGQEGSHGRPPAEEQRPSSDERSPSTSTDRSRPQTELKP